MEIDTAGAADGWFRLRDWGYAARCIVFKEHDADRWHLTGILNPLENRRIAGAAVDLGTSRVVIRLVELSNGEILFEIYKYTILQR